MPKSKNDDQIAYSDLTPLAQGYADALLECQGSCAIADEWHGIGRDDFMKDTLRKVAEDCSSFLNAARKCHPDGEDGLLFEIDEYNLGFHFYLARQGTGVAFHGLGLDDLGEKLEECAAGFGWIAVEITTDRRIAFLPATPVAAPSPSN